MKLNKRGMEMNSMANILIGFLAIIIGLVLLTQAIAPNIGKATDYAQIVNTSFTPPNVGSAYVLLEGQRVVDFVAINNTGNTIPSTNYTITDYYKDTTTGEARSTLVTLTGDDVNDTTWNITYTFEPVGYIKDSGARSIANIVILFSILAVLVSAIVIAYNKDLLGMIGK